MGVSDFLEDFSIYTRGRPVSLTDVSLEEQRLEAFERGYQAGWDDSVKAASDDNSRISADFAQSIKDLSFTYHEAHAAVLRSLKPLLEQMMATLMPEVLRQSLGALVVEQVQDMAKDSGPLPVELVTAPGNANALESLLVDELPMPLTVKVEDTLPEGQLFIRFGPHEREIDMSGVVSDIHEKVSGFFEENEKEIA